MLHTFEKPTIKISSFGPCEERENDVGKEEDKEIARRDSTRTRTSIQQRKIKKLVIYRNCNMAQGASFHYFNYLVQDSLVKRKAMLGSKACVFH